MAIQFRCPACSRRLSIATRKAGAKTACPNCKAVVTVPGEPALAEPPPAAHRRVPLMALLAGGALLLVVGVAIALAVAPRKPVAPAAEQARIESPAAPAPSAPVPTPTSAPQVPVAPVSSVPVQPTPSAAPQPQSTPQVPAPQPTPVSQPEPAVAPPPHVVVKPPPPQPVPDRFGNPVGQNVGLGKDGEFKGKRLLFWSGFENAGRVFFAASNPLWKALEVKGFVVRREFGRFNPAWLKDVDQLWVLSTGRFELPAGVTPDLLIDALSLLPAEAVPSGFTLEEYKFIVRATLDVAFSPVYPLDEKAYKAIEDFVRAGKGLCLLADDEPFTREADELARRLFGARVSGNYIADKVAHVRGRGLTAADVKKFGGQFEVDDHALLAGVNFLFEGITVSSVSKSDKLGAALKASDGQTLVAVSKVPGQRVVIDCGFTRYCHGPDPRVSYIQKTAGSVRLGQNIAAYLAGKDAPDKP